MPRRNWAMAGLLAAAIAILGLSLLSGSIVAVLTAPFHALRGTGDQINARLLEAAESPETLREAGRLLLRPLGVVRLVRSHETADADAAR